VPADRAVAAEILAEEARLDELTRLRDNSSRRLDQLRAAQDGAGEAGGGYRYGDSNPGFRTENWLWEAVCGRSRSTQSKEFDSVRLSSVESGTKFGTKFRGWTRSHRTRKVALS